MIQSKFRDQFPVLDRWLLVVLLLASSASAFAEWTVQEIRVDGLPRSTLEKVKVTRPGNVPGEETLRSGTSATVFESNTLLQSPAKTVIVLSSPSGTQEIRSATSVKLLGDGKGEMVEILKGSVSFEVLKKLNFFYVKHDPGNHRPFVAGVPGTSFTVDVIPDKDISFDVKQGKVWVEHLAQLQIDDASTAPKNVAVALQDVLLAGTTRKYSLNAEEYFFRRQSWAGAVEFFNEQLIEARKSTDQRRVMSVLRSLGEVDLARGASLEALPYFDEALKIASDDPTIESYWKATLENNMGIANLQIGNFSVAVEHLKAALKLYADTPEMASEPAAVRSEMTGVHINIAGAYNEMGLRECALASADGAVRNRADKYSYPQIYALIGKSLSGGNALQCYRKALVNQSQISFPHAKGDLELAKAHIDVGFALVATKKGKKDIQEAETGFQRARKMVDDAYPGKPHPLLSDIEQGLAQMAAISGRPVEAIAGYEKALTILKNTPPDETTLRLAGINSDLGDTYVVQKRWQDAVAAYQVALSRWGELFADEVHPEIAVIYQKLAKLLAILNQPERAKEASDKSIAILKQVNHRNSQCLRLEFGTETVDIRKLEQTLIKECN